MKSTTVGNVMMESGEGVLSPKEKEAFRGSPKKTFQGSPQKGKEVLKPRQKPIKCYRCDGWGHGWKECPTPKKLEVEGASRGCSFLKSPKYWHSSNSKFRTQTVISKALKQRDLYHK